MKRWFFLTLIAISVMVFSVQFVRHFSDIDYSSVVVYPEELVFRDSE